ncbi:MAG: DUF6152 family protein [Candidatus Rariloculaceae bacterium]
MRIIIVALSVLIFPAYVFGHHSRAEFANETVEIEGVLTEVVWQNPHIALFVDVTGDDGEVESWRIEGWSRPAALEASGVTQDLFAIGETITVAGRSSRLRQALLATNVLLAGGTEAVVAPVDRRWDGPVLGTESEPAPQMADATAENLGLFRAWYPDGNPMMVLRRFSFTEQALASRQTWDPVDNPIVRCDPIGLPVPMFHGRPIQFSDDGQSIGLHHSYLDTRRNIHVDDAPAAANQEPSPLGYSTGHWADEQTLVIETSRINYPVFHIDGTSQTDAIKITEHYSLSADQTRLELQLTIEDPATLTETGTANMSFVALDEPFSVYECNVF